jgi:hypothetical protein
MSTAGQPVPRPPAANPTIAGAPAAAVGSKPSSAAAVVKRPVGPSEDFARSRLRRSVYALLTAVSVGAMIGRILAVNSVDVVRAETRVKDDVVKQRLQELDTAGKLKGRTDAEIQQIAAQIENDSRADWQRQRPFLSANDRSRWLTMRALVERGTYSIEQYVTDPLTYPNWDTIDLVMHQDAEGNAHLYSSKPPLLATLYAGPYWVIYKVSAAIRGTPATLSTNPYEIDRGMLILLNVLPLMIYFIALAAMIERFGCTDWGRIFVFAAAAFGTFLTTFAVVLNNHLPAAVCAAITLYAALRIWYDAEDRLRYFLLAGFFGALMAACELPALSLFAIVSAALLWKAPRAMLIAYCPAALIVVAAFFATNWIEFHSLVPAYAHRTYDRSSQPDAAHGYDGTVKLDSGATVQLRGNPDNWYDYEFTRTDGRTIQSYWRQPQGIDAGEASVGKYAVNLLVGHHGIVSLTPIWLLAIPGFALLFWDKNYRLRGLAIAALLVTIVCILFYIFRPAIERNYGGTTSGFRWVFWLTPLWLMAALPTADKLSTWRAGRIVGCIFLMFSVLSATYPVWNPFTHPWLWNLWQYMGW